MRQVSRYSGFAQRVVEAKRGVAEINNNIEESPEVYEESLQKSRGIMSRNNINQRQIDENLQRGTLRQSNIQYYINKPK